MKVIEELFIPSPNEEIPVSAAFGLFNERLKHDSLDIIQENVFGNLMQLVFSGQIVRKKKRMNNENGANRICKFLFIYFNL